MKGGKMKSKTCQRIGKIIYEQGHTDGYGEGIDLRQEDEYEKGYNDGYDRGKEYDKMSIGDLLWILFFMTCGICTGFVVVGCINFMI